MTYDAINVLQQPHVDLSGTSRRLSRAYQYCAPNLHTVTH